MKIKLFPDKELPEHKIDIIIRDLRIILQQKNISYLELFKKLDKNQDGFISFDEFEENIESVMRLSQPVKEGIFSYLDRLKVGMVDFNTFKELMNKTLFIQEIRTTEDNWNW